MHKLLQRVKMRMASKLAREQTCGGGGEGLEDGGEGGGGGGKGVEGWGRGGEGRVESKKIQWKFAVDEGNSKDIMIEVIMVTHYVKQQTDR